MSGILAAGIRKQFQVEPAADPLADVVDILFAAMSKSNANVNLITELRSRPTSTESFVLPPMAQKAAWLETSSPRLRPHGQPSLQDVLDVVFADVSASLVLPWVSIPVK